MQPVPPRGRGLESAAGRSAAGACWQRAGQARVHRRVGEGEALVKYEIGAEI